MSRDMVSQTVPTRSRRIRRLFGFPVVAGTRPKRPWGGPRHPFISTTIKGMSAFYPLIKNAPSGNVPGTECNLPTP